MSSFDLIHLYPCATIKKKIFADKKKIQQMKIL